MASSDAPNTPTPAAASPTADAYESLSAVVFVIGLTNGVAPFVVRLLFSGDAVLVALPLRLPSPWWWIVSLTVLITTAVLLEGLDRAQRRASQVRDLEEVDLGGH